MINNIWYLFISGILLGSGPCLSLCAPILISYSAAMRTTFKKTLISYIVFSIAKISGYMILGTLAGLGMKIMHSEAFKNIFDITYILMGIFIVFIGFTIIFLGHKRANLFCAWIHKKNIRNTGLLGFLMGLSPCLPLLGILNYVMMISRSLHEAILFTIVFGIGTIISPLPLLMGLSAKTSSYLSKNNIFFFIIRLISAAVIIILGIRVIAFKIAV